MLLHPGGAMHSVWLPITRAWGNRYHMLAPDLILPGTEPVSLPALATQVIALLQQQTATPVWLIGSSLGANVALLVTARVPQLVAGLVLDSAQVGGPPPALLPGLILFLKGLVRVTPHAFITAMLLRQFAHYDQADKLALRAELETVGKLGFLEQIEAHFDYDIRPSLSSISVPVLILAGEQDMLTKAGEPDKLQAGIKSAVVKVVPQAGHVTFLQQPAIFQQVVTEFLAAQS